MQRNSAGFDAYPNVGLLRKLGAIRAESELELVRDHSLLGTVQCFYGPESWVKHLASMDGQLLKHNRARSNPRKYWHICPSCREDECANGIPTWQRDAQLPGLRYCGKCGGLLSLVTNTRVRSSRPPSKNDLVISIGRPVRARRREQYHVQLASDLSTALNRKLPYWGPQKLRAKLLEMLESCGFVESGAQQKIPWRILLPHIVQTFGENIFVEAELQFAVRRIKHGVFFKEPAPDSLVLLALATRSFGMPLAELFRTPSTMDIKPHGLFNREALKEGLIERGRGTHVGSC